MMAVHIDVLAFLTSLKSTSLVLIGVTAFLFYVRTKPVPGQPPGPYHLPVLGSLPFMEDSDIRKALIKMANKYGNVFTVYLASQKAVVLNGYDVIKEALLKNGVVFSGRPYIFWGRPVERGHGIVYTHGESSQEQRRFLVRVLKDYGMSKHTMEDLILDETSNLLSLFKSHINKPYNPKEHLSMTTSNILTNIAFGRKFDYSDPVFTEVVQATEECFKGMASDSLIHMVPYLKHLPGDLIGYQKFMKSTGYLFAMMRRWIAEHKQELLEGQEPTDFVGSYLVEMAKRQKVNNYIFSEEQLEHVMLEAFFGGIDTASTTIAWLILMMTNHPEIQDKVYSELNSVLGSDKIPSLEDRMNLPYTEAVIAETLRHCNVVPLALPHAPLTDVTLNGYKIPEGTMVIINGYSVDMDPELWPNPEQFIPERHIDDKGKFKKSDKQMTFSLGKRACPGESMARMELFLMFASIMQQVQFTLPDGVTKLDTNGFNVVTFQPKPYDVIMKLHQ